MKTEPVVLAFDRRDGAQDRTRAEEMPTAPPVSSESRSIETAPATPTADAPIARGVTSFLRKHRHPFFTTVLGTVSLLLLLGIWHFGTKYKIEAFVRFTNIPPPADVFASAVKQLQNTRFQTSIGISIRRIFLGFLIAVVCGVGLGVLIGRFRWVRDLTFPALEVLRPIPAIAWVPMSIMLWPTNEASIVFITFIGSFFPILLNTVHGVDSLDKVLVRAAQSLGARGFTLFWHVMLPGTLPHIFTGLAVGMGVAWVSLIAAEMISGQFGIGYFTWEAYSLVNYADIALGMIVIGVLGLLCSGLIRVIGKRLMPWRALHTAEERQ